MKRKKEKDISGCDEQPLWQRVFKYIVEIVIMLLKLFLITVFWGMLILIKGHNTDSFIKLLILCCLIFVTLSIECLDKVPAEIILLLFILSYWITYGVVLKCN